MALLIGILLAIGTCFAAAAIGLDRSRNFYPVMVIVIASYYVLFAVIGGSDSAIWRESAIALAFAAVAVAGFRANLWLAALALAGHGAMDFVHEGTTANPGMPDWWPAFCAAFDVTAAACLAMLILTGRRAASAVVQAGTGASS